jgi:hypothetical protein
MRFPHDHFGDFATAIDAVNTPETQMADNDYAIGLLVEKVSNSSYKDSTLILIISQLDTMFTFEAQGVCGGVQTRSLPQSNPWPKASGMSCRPHDTPGAVTACADTELGAARRMTRVGERATARAQHPPAAVPDAWGTGAARPPAKPRRGDLPPP